MYVKPYERALMDVATYRLHKRLYVYASPLIVGVGVVGNLLAFVVLVQRPLRHVSTASRLHLLLPHRARRRRHPSPLRRPPAQVDRTGDDVRRRPRSLPAAPAGVVYLF